MSNGNSILAVKYKDGVLIGCDTALSYGGGFHKYHNVDRVHVVGDATAVASSGRWSDMQFLMEDVYELQLEDQLAADGRRLTDAKSLHHYLKLVLYNKRCNFEPSMTSVIVAGKEKGQEPFIGWVDPVGSFSTADAFANGLGFHLCMPLLLKATENGKWKNLTRDDAVKVLNESLEILAVRQRCASAKVMITDITDAGVNKSAPYVLSMESMGRGVVHDQQIYVAPMTV